MTNRVSKTIGTIVIAISLFALLTPLWVSGKSEGGRIEGAWDVQVSIRNCIDGREINTFKSVTTFMSGGTLVDTTSGVPQELRTPGQGVWSHIGGNSYRFSFKSFNFGPATVFTGWTTVVHEATLDSSGDEFASAGTARVYDKDGNLLFQGCSSTTATRFE